MANLKSWKFHENSLKNQKFHENSLKSQKVHENSLKLCSKFIDNSRKSKKFQLGFSSDVEVPQLSSARLGTFIARLGSSWKIPARAHQYKVV